MTYVKVKNSMSWIDIKAWILECKKYLENSIVDNVYNPSGNLVIFKLRCSDGMVRNLIIEPGRRIHFTRYKLNLEGSGVTAIARALRRRVRGLKILSVEMLGYERIIKFSFRDRKLIAELLPRGVILTLDNEDKVDFSTEYKDMKDRSIRKGVVYKPPPTIGVGVEYLSVEVLKKHIISEKKNILYNIVKGLGLPGEFVEEVLYRARVEKTIKPSELKNAELTSIISSIREVYVESLGGKGYIVSKDEELLTVTPFNPLHLKSYNIEVYESFNEALDQYFSRLYVKGQVKLKATPMDMEVERLKRIIEEQSEKVEEYAKASKAYEEAANFIASNIPVLEKFIECVRRALRGEVSFESCSDTFKVEGIDKHGNIIVRLYDLKFNFKPYERAINIMGRLYKLSKEYQRKSEKAKKVMEELMKKLSSLTLQAKSLKEIAKASVKPVEWYERYHWITLKDGTLIIGGKNADQNESLVKKYLRDKDVFVHADIRGAPAVIIRCYGEPSKDALREAGVLTACYSKAWKERMGYVDVYWVYGNQVTKTPPPGEYLPKGSFMIRGKRNYIKGVTLRLALGVKIVNGYGKVVVGSEDHVSSETPYYVVLMPGDKAQHVMAEEILEIIKKNIPKDLKHIVEAISKEEIISRLPGPSTIVLTSKVLRKN